MADRMIVMNGGIAEQIGTPLEVYETPRTLFAAQFIGSPAMNIVDAQVKDGQIMLGDSAMGAATGPDGPVKLGVRPEHMNRDDAGPLVVTVQMTEPLGANTFAARQTGKDEPSFHREPARCCICLDPSNREMRFSVQAEKAHLFDADTGLRRTTD